MIEEGMFTVTKKCVTFIFATLLMLSVSNAAVPASTVPEGESFPPRVSAIRGSTIAVRTVSAMNYRVPTSMGILPDGTLIAWGSGYLNSEEFVTESPPISVLSDVAAVTLDTWQALAITSDGGLWAWAVTFGRPPAGQLGEDMTPRRVMDNVVYATTGGANSLVITADGVLWGVGMSGWLFDEDGTTFESADTPVRVMDNVKTAAISTNHILVVTNDGTVWTWGREIDGRLGTDHRGDRHAGKNSMIRVMDNVAAVAAGHNHSLALTYDGVVWAWGSNFAGQLGVPGHRSHDGPVRVMDDVVAIAAGGNGALSRGHSFAITSDGGLWGWGFNGAEGRIGIDYGSNAHIFGQDWNQGLPVRILDNVVSITTHEIHSMALTDDGAVWMWGDSEPSFGVLTARHRTPRRVMDGFNTTLP